jgi:hypothetical protein
MRVSVAQDRFRIRVVSRCNDGFSAGRLTEGDLDQSDRRTDYWIRYQSVFTEKDLGTDLNLAQKRAIETVLAAAAQAGRKPDTGSFGRPSAPARQLHASAAPPAVSGMVRRTGPS